MSDAVRIAERALFLLDSDLGTASAFARAFTGYALSLSLMCLTLTLLTPPTPELDPRPLHLAQLLSRPRRPGPPECAACGGSGRGPFGPRGEMCACPKCGGGLRSSESRARGVDSSAVPPPLRGELSGEVRPCVPPVPGFPR